MKLKSIVRIDIKSPDNYTKELYDKINNRVALVLAYKEYERKYGVENILI